MAFAEATGDFLWQMTHEKLTSGRVNDWPQQGVCSTPFVEGNRLFYTSNRATLVSLDTEGLKDGNAGPVSDEKAKGPNGGDVVWEYDMMAELDVFPHNLAVSSPLVVDGILYATTGNGVDEGHINIPVPTAPSFVAVEAATGKLVWESNLPGDKILHGTWSNPAYGVIKGRPQVIFPGGNGWVYSFEPKTGKLLWKFDANPKDSKWVLGGRGTRNNIIATPVIWEDKVYIAVGQDPEHGEGVGNFWAIDASLDGDVTGKAAVWHRGGNDFHRTISTVAIHDGIVYAADLSGFLYALDARTGTLHWKHDLLAAVWGSPYVADGRVYIGDEDGDIAILKAGKTKEVIAEPNVGVSVYTTPVAKNGVLYLLGRNRLFALQAGAQGKPSGPGVHLALGHGAREGKRPAVPFAPPPTAGVECPPCPFPCPPQEAVSGRLRCVVSAALHTGIARWPFVRKKSLPSEIAGVAIVTSPRAFFASSSKVSAARTT
jgi:outer membrane protein assembly factor BamB